MSDARDPGLFETLYTTRALRRFRPDPVPDEVLFQLVDAAIRAPSGQNAQDWRFVLIRDPETKAKLQAFAAQAWDGYGPDPASLDELPRSQRLSWRSVEHLVHHLAEAPVIVSVSSLVGRHSTPGGSTYPAVQNLLLAARALGLAASIFNMPLRRHDEVRELLRIPDSNEIRCLVPLGYPEDRFGPVRRKPVAKVAFLDRWGEVWPYATEQPSDGWTDRWA